MNPTVKIVHPDGILDGPKGTQLRQEISKIIHKDDILLIDFQNVTFMDSSGLGALVLALKTVRAAGAKLFICSINDQIRMLFELTSMEKVFQVFPSREEFSQVIGKSE
jgi:anti-sigma B factor antagonist